MVRNAGDWWDWQVFPCIFTPIWGLWLSILTVITPPAFPLTNHHLKPADFAKLSSSDLSFSAVFSPLDLLLFKLYSVMFYTTIDNKIALEAFLTVPFLWNVTSK